MAVIKNTRFSLGTWLVRELMEKKFMSPLGIFLLSIIAVTAGVLAANGQVIIVFIFIAALFGAGIVYCCVFRPLLGYYVTSLIAYFAFYPTHILNKEFPISTIVEVLILFLFIGTIWFTNSDKWKGNLFKTGISILLLINVLYYCIELFNPEAMSRDGWLFSSKRYAVYILFYIITYRLIDTPQKFRYFFKFWVVMAFIGGAYACFQQWFGYLPMELKYIQSDPHEYGLLFQGGVLRKYSFFDGVVTSGILCGSFAVIALVLAINEKKKKRKWLLFMMTWFLTMGMVYSGTRTTTIMLPAGIALYSLMTIKNKTTLVTLFVSFLVVAFLMVAPIDSPALDRMRSTFNKDDESLNVRDVNRHYIQPYIYAHPLGGGIAASGVEGMRFNPGHPLAGFPPDSGFLKFALDMGWLGLTVTVFFYLIILYTGILYYYKIENEEYRVYVLAIVTAMFSTMVTQYSQVSIGQIPHALFFYGVISLFKRLLEFDEKEISIFNKSPNSFSLSTVF